MQSAKDVEQSIKKLTVESGERIHGRILDRLLRKLDTSKKHANTWRIIMRNPITKIAAAAIIAILVAWVFLFSPPTSGNRAWARMLDIMKEMNWIHFEIEFDTPPEVTEQMTQSFEYGFPLWMCFDPEVQISKKLNGEIFYTDCDQGVRYHYSPDSNTVTIDSHSARHELATPRSALEIIDYYTELLQESNLSIQSESLVRDGKELEMLGFSHGGVNVTGTRDVARNLLIEVTVEAKTPENGSSIKAVVRLSYPNEGPADIFAAGVPAGVQIVDNRPDGGADELMQELQRRFDHNYGDRICVVTCSKSFAGEDLQRRRMVVSRKQKNLYRADTYNAEEMAPNPDMTIYQQTKDVWPNINIEEAMLVENSHCVISQDIFDGKYALLRQGGPPAESLRTAIHHPANGPTYPEQQDVNSWAWINPYDLGVNNARIEETVARLPENAAYRGLTGLEVSFELDQKGPLLNDRTFQIINELWIDPQKDHMVIHRIRRQHQYVAGRIVQTFVSEAHILETSQTSDGQWYPLHVERKMHYSDDLNSNDEINDIIIQIDTNWKASDAIFDKDYVPGSR